jgi:hypothetical protein
MTEQTYTIDLGEERRLTAHLVRLITDEEYDEVMGAYEQLVRRRVLNGLATLEKRYEGTDTDWRDTIDCDSLNLAAGSSCVLGQTDGDYGIGVARLTREGLLDEATPAALGFTTGAEIEALEETDDDVLPGAGVVHTLPNGDELYDADGMWWPLQLEWMRHLCPDALQAVG